MSVEKKEVKRLPTSKFEMFDKTDDKVVAPELMRPGVKNYEVDKEKPKVVSQTTKSYSRLSSKKPLPDNPIFHAPMVLLSTVDGKTTCNESTLCRLKEIQQPLNIVSIVGTLRTGKSLLLNKLAIFGAVKKEACFEIGHTTDAVTKGVWVMCRPHPTQENQVLVLLDTEGIDDPDKVDIEDDKNLFILATLLSSTLVYNTKGNFDRTTIDKFKFLNKIKTSIKVNGSEKDDSILDFFFPNFVLTLRDVTLDTNSKNADAFMEKRLNMKCSQKCVPDESLKEYNLPRMLIRRYFKKRKCFLFIKPVKRTKLEEMLTLDESTFKKEFQQTLDEFRSYIFSCKPKSLKSGKVINGRMFCTLVLNYVHSIQNGEAPCLNSAMKSMAASENAFIVRQASEAYRDEMKKRMGSYVPKEKGLVNYHKDSMKAAVEVLKAGLIIDDEQIYEDLAMACFKQQFDKIKEVVKKDGEAKCREILQRLDTTIIQVKIENEMYSSPIGYDDYMKDIDSLIEQYKKESSYMGSVALSALKEFLANKSKEEEEVFSLAQAALNGKEGLERRDIKRLSMFMKSDADILKEEEEVENALRADIEILQRNGLQNIGEQYREMLTSKIEEIDRVKNELTPDNSYFKKLREETYQWKTILENDTFNLSQTETPLQPFARQPGPDMETTVYEKPWRDNDIETLWKKAVEAGFKEDGDVSSSDVLGERVPPVGLEATPTYSDPPQKRGQKNKHKCIIS